MKVKHVNMTSILQIKVCKNDTDTNHGIDNIEKLYLLETQITNPIRYFNEMGHRIKYRK